MLAFRYFGILLLSALGASFDFFMFPFFPETAFVIHNILALLVAAGIIVISYRLLRRKTADMALDYLSILVGLSMIAVHLSKLFLGK